MTVNLAKGKHRSCGCKTSDLLCEARGFTRDTHRPEYRVYRQMLDRCHLPTARNFQWYGAKGVSVCHRWRFGEGGLSGFKCFMADVGDRPAGMTLDRIDPRLDYEPGNVRWATWDQQAENKREHYLSEPIRRRLRHLRSLAHRGEASGVAKLTEDQVSEIKGKISRGARTSDLARQYHVAPQTISGIKSGRKWSHVAARGF